MQRFIRRDNNECFIGVMQYIYFKTFKKHISEHRIKRIFNYTYKGVSVGSVVKEVEAVGFNAKSYEVIANTKINGKYIVARKVGDLIHFFGCIDQIFFDPATGKEEKDDVRIGDIVIVLNESKNFNPFDDVIKINKSGIELPIVVLVGFLGSILAIYGSYFMNDLHTFIALSGNVDFVLYKYLVIGFIGILLLVTQRIMMQKILAKINQKVLKQYSKALLESSISIARHFSLAHIKRVASDISMYVEFEIAKKIELLNSIVLFCCAIYLIALESVVLLSLSISSAFLFAFFKVIFKHKQKLNFEKLREKSLSLDDTVNHLHQNIKRAVGNDKGEYEKLLDEDVKTLVKYNLNFSKTIIGQDMILQTVVTAFSIVLPVIIFTKMPGNSIDIGKGLFLVLISGFLFNNLVNILSFIVNYEQNDVYRFKVSDFLIGDRRVKENFTYDGQKNFEPIAKLKGHNQIIGNNGAGKTTILSLMAGLESNFDSSIQYLSSESLPLKEGNKMIGRNNMSQGERQIVNGMLLMESSCELVILDEAFNSVKKDLRMKIYEDILRKFENVIIVDHDITLNINNIIV